MMAESKTVPTRRGRSYKDRCHLVNWRGDALDDLDLRDALAEVERGARALRRVVEWAECINHASGDQVDTWLDRVATAERRYRDQLDGLHLE